MWVVAISTTRDLLKETLNFGRLHLAGWWQQYRILVEQEDEKSGFFSLDLGLVLSLEGGVYFSELVYAPI